MAVLDGQLYAGSGKYRLQRSGRCLKRKTRPSAEACFDIEAARNGRIVAKVSSDTETIGGLVAFRGKLYATSAYKPAGLFRYEGGKNLDRARRVWKVAVPRRSAMHNGRIYTSVWDGGSVFEFDGEKFN